MNQRAFLEQIARRAMREHGLEPDFPDAALAQAAQATAANSIGLRDLRSLPWSSIDNDESRDLDQLEVIQSSTNGVSRVLVAIADVDALVRQGGAVDDHARLNTTSVYTTAKVFPMLPETLSTDKTSLVQNSERAAIVIQMDVDRDGTVRGGDVFTALVRNGAKLAYDSVSAWLEGHGAAPGALAADQTMADQVRQQDAVAQALRRQRQANGALEFDRGEIKPLMAGDEISDITTVRGGRARDLIEEFMVAANGTTARFLESRHVPSLRRVVRSPERWPRIVALAATHGTTLPDVPEAKALEAFLATERKRSPDTFDELSLAVIKLLGRGEYAVTGARGQDSGGSPEDAGHFALAVSSYTHSTAPNRRFPDLIVQRLIKATTAGRAPSYSVDDLAALAAHCTTQEDAANKVERLVQKAAAALWLSSKIGQEFDGIVTGASPKGTWVRIKQPFVEGRVEQGFHGLDVGDRVRVRLISTDPERGFIDFARV
jgi:VacB/RNase II family 3'-5' exoribonuclease